jgi:DNA-binding transcriptional ArsR family regulator
MNPSTDFEPKEFHVITDMKKIKLLLEGTRREIVFRYLVAREMTVKQLADAMGKKPGTVLHHVNKLKQAGIIKQVRTRETETGILERYYRAIAKDFRLGISEVIGPEDEPHKVGQSRAKSTILGLSTLGVTISGKDLEKAKAMLTKLYAIETEILNVIDKRESIAYQSLPPATRNDVAWAMLQFLLSKNGKYQELLRRWHDFLSIHLNSEAQIERRT